MKLNTIVRRIQKRKKLTQINSSGKDKGEKLIRSKGTKHKQDSKINQI